MHGLFDVVDLERRPRRRILERVFHCERHTLAFHSLRRLHTAAHVHVVNVADGDINDLNGERLAQEQLVCFVVVPPLEAQYTDPLGLCLVLGNS